MHVLKAQDRLCIDQLGGQSVFERALGRIKDLPRNTETDILETEVLLHLGGSVFSSWIPIRSLFPCVLLQISGVVGGSINKEVLHLLLWVALSDSKK